jgi:hypothetical protein
MHCFCTYFHVFFSVEGWDDELEGSWKEVIVAYVTLLYKHLPWRNKETHENLSWNTVNGDG